MAEHKAEEQARTPGLDCHSHSRNTPHSASTAAHKEGNNFEEGDYLVGGEHFLRPSNNSIARTRLTVAG